MLNFFGSKRVDRENPITATPVFSTPATAPLPSKSLILRPLSDALEPTLLSDSVRARVRAAILEPVRGISSDLNREILNAHVAADICQKYAREHQNEPPAISLPGAAEFE